MNVLLHGLSPNEFEAFHDDTLANEWHRLCDNDPGLNRRFDAAVSTPPFSLRWEPDDDLRNDARFARYGLAPKSAADLAFLLHGFHYLSEYGTMVEIKDNDYNLSISRYVSTEESEVG